MTKSVARCTKCGREFITMPPDGSDHFGLCGGKVVPQNDALAGPLALDRDMLARDAKIKPDRKQFREFGGNE